MRVRGVPAAEPDAADRGHPEQETGASGSEYREPSTDYRGPEQQAGGIEDETRANGTNSDDCGDQADRAAGGSRGRNQQQETGEDGYRRSRAEIGAQYRNPRTLRQARQ